MKEQRDFFLGRLFGAEALIRSGILFAVVDDIRPWTSTLDLILQLAAEKPWLREECGYVMFAAIRDSVLPRNRPQYALTIAKKMQSFGLVKTPEGVAIWIALRSQYPDAILPVGLWHQESPLGDKERSNLARILREATAASTTPDKDENAAHTGQLSAKPHFAWQAIISNILSGPPPKPAGGSGSSDSSNFVTFRQFWIACVDSRCVSEGVQIVLSRSRWSVCSYFLP